MFMKFLWKFCGGSMIFLLDFVRFPWYFYDISIAYSITTGFLWGANGMSMGFLWGFKSMPMGFPLDSCGISLGFL